MNMRFYEVIDGHGVSFYRWDPDFDILYFWNENDSEWEPSIFCDTQELSRYVVSVDETAVLQEVREGDIH